MDDMIFEYNNQSSIYVLNSSCSSYGEFPRLNHIDQITLQLGALTAEDKDLCFQSARAIGPGNQLCALQRKLKTLEAEVSTTPSPLAPLAPSPTRSTAAAAIQKLFNFSGASSSSLNGGANISQGNNNQPLSASARDIGGAPLGSCSQHLTGKKKCSTVKSTLIAKKTKFWKVLEEEKLRAADGKQQLGATDAHSSGNLVNYQSSCAHRSQSAVKNRASPLTQTGHLIAAKSQHDSINEATSDEWQPEQCGCSNWSRSDDKSQQHPEKPQRRSSYELYSEAAELLGLTCTLCDNCRCLECQSGYFDCDDSDSYSEFSVMDEYEEEAIASAAEFMMYADDYNEASQALQTNHECLNANCHMTGSYAGGGADVAGGEGDPCSTANAGDVCQWGTTTATAVSPLNPQQPPKDTLRSCSQLNKLSLLNANGHPTGNVS